MNNRLFLYSGLFLVLILLYDSWQNRFDQNVVTPESMPETIQESEQVKSEPSTKSNIELPEKMDDNIESILVVTDTLELKISLADGSVISSKLLKYPENFGSNDLKVQLLDDSDRSYVAKVGLSLKALFNQKSIDHYRKNIFLRTRTT